MSDGGSSRLREQQILIPSQRSLRLLPAPPFRFDSPRYPRFPRSCNCCSAHTEAGSVPGSRTIADRITTLEDSLHG